MEKEGFIRTVDNLEHNVHIKTISTDRHNQIRKLMATSPKYNHISHKFDPWHISKNILKKLVKCSKKKGLFFKKTFGVEYNREIKIGTITFYRFQATWTMGILYYKSFVMEYISL